MKIYEDDYYQEEKCTKIENQKYIDLIKA